MRNRRVVDSFHKIAPSDAAKERMLRHVFERSRSEGSKTKAKDTFNRKRLAPIAACLLVFVAVAAFFGSSHWFAGQGGNMISQNRTEQSGNRVATQNPQDEPTAGKSGGAVHPSDFLVLTAYAASEEGQTLTENFLSETAPTILQPKAEVPLAGYTPLMSAVPGLPFTFGTGKYGYGISVSADKGELLGWNQETGEITHHGKKAAVGSGTTIYWTPITEGGSASSATLSVSATEGGKIVVTQNVAIAETRPGFYSAMAGEPSVI